MEIKNLLSTEDFPKIRSLVQDLIYSEGYTYNQVFSTFKTAAAISLDDFHVLMKIIDIS